MLYIVNSMEMAITVNALKELVLKAEVDGRVNVLVKEVTEHGQAFKNKVELALRSRR